MNSRVARRLDITTDKYNTMILESINKLKDEYKLTWDFISIDLFGYGGPTSVKNKCNGTDPSPIDPWRVDLARKELSKLDIWILHKPVLDFTTWRLIHNSEDVEKPQGTIADLIPDVVMAIAKAEQGIKSMDASSIKDARRLLDKLSLRLESERAVVESIMFKKERLGDDFDYE